MSLTVCCAFGAAAEVRASGIPVQSPVIARLMEAKQIVNVHEHIQGAENAGEILQYMDTHGIGKTILLGSSWFTISLYERAGFTRYDDNNAALMKLVADYPGRFEAWPTLNPTDSEALAKITALIEQGATGIKLYLGHGYRSRYRNEYLLHPMSMDDPRMDPIYAFLEERGVPVCFHVNPAMPGFAEEFIAVLTKYPDLKVNAPHFLLSAGAPPRLEEFLRVFPNLYVDISFGHDDFLKDGLRRISRRADWVRGIVNAYPDRFMFGTDFVVTSFRPKPPDWYDTRIQAYYDLLSQTAFSTSLLPGENLTGLHLDDDVIERIMHRNYETFAASKPENTVLKAPVDWDKMWLRRTGRSDGQVLPPPAQR
ncbi:MAG: amidohydrolase [Candidatus Hydrogenedentes bacterium]|nr:amidohydrolase [Candidatus Hydrogenedentota bacterium]